MYDHAGRQIATIWKDGISRHFSVIARYHPGTCTRGLRRSENTSAKAVGVTAQIRTQYKSVALVFRPHSTKFDMRKYDMKTCSEKKVYDTFKRHPFLLLVR